jgi:hypothetical protein
MSGMMKAVYQGESLQADRGSSMFTRVVGRSAVGVIVAALAIASLNVAAFAAPTPTTGGHTYGQGASGVQAGRENESGHGPNQYWAPSRVTNVQPCAYGQSAFLDPNSGDPMMSASPPSPYNTIGAYTAGGPTLLSFFGYGNASLSSWWMSPAGQSAMRMGLNPLTNPCGTPANFLPDGW